MSKYTNSTAPSGRAAITVADLTREQVEVIEQLVATYRRMRDGDPRGGFVYFAQHVDSRKIKIGHTTRPSPLARVLQVQVEGPWPPGIAGGAMELIGFTHHAEDVRKAEREQQRRWAPLLISGAREWYHPGADLLYYIREVNLDHFGAPVIDLDAII